MKIEGYLFIPYEGQLRFSFDTTQGDDSRSFGQSDRDYDKVLGVHEMTGGRPITCMELKYAGSQATKWAPVLRPLIRAGIAPKLEYLDHGEIVKEDLGESPHKVFKGAKHRVYATFTSAKESK